MDRDSLRRLRAQPGYLRFVSAATLARVSDEMFGVGVLMVIDQIVIASVLLALVALVGHAPTWAIVLVVLPAGLTYPLSFGGFTSMIPSLVPGELLPPANALETTSFNSALVVGPALAGTLSATIGPAAPLFVEAALALAALALIVRIPKLDGQAERSAGDTLLGIAAQGLRQIVSVPQLRGVTAAAALGLGGLGLLTVAFPLFAVDHLGVEESASGYMWAAFAVGSTFGALTLVHLQRRFPPERIVLTGYALFGLLMLTWQLAGTLAVFLALVALAGMVDGPALAAQFAVRQQHVPPRLYGQVFTTAVGLKVGCLALGAGILVRLRRDVVHRVFRALARTREEEQRRTAEREQVLTQRALEQACDDERARPHAGSRDHGSVAEREVEAHPLGPRVEQREDAEADQELADLDEREWTERAHDEQQRRARGHALLRVEDARRAEGAPDHAAARTPARIRCASSSASASDTVRSCPWKARCQCSAGHLRTCSSSPASSTAGTNSPSSSTISGSVSKRHGYWSAFPGLPGQIFSRSSYISPVTRTMPPKACTPVT